MTRKARIAAGAAGAGMLGMLATALGGWAAAGVSRPPPAATAFEGRGLQLRYEVRREPAYVPPPPADATRLDVLDAQAATRVEDAVLSSQAGYALRALQSEDAARAASALAEVRAADARIDREAAAALADERASHRADDLPAPTAGPA